MKELGEETSRRGKLVEFGERSYVIVAGFWDVAKTWWEELKLKIEEEASRSDERAERRAGLNTTLNRRTAFLPNLS